MLDMGFEKFIRLIMLEKDMPSNIKRQTVMFSATFPKVIQKLAKDFLKENYIYLKIGKTSNTEFITQKIRLVENNLEKKFFLIEELSKQSNMLTLSKKNFFKKKDYI